MRDLLPFAFLKIKIPAALFFEQIITVAGKLPDLIVDHERMPRASFDQEVLEIECCSHALHQGLRGMMVAKSNESRVRFEVRAKHWHGQERPDFETYVEALKFVFRDLIKAYNQAFKARFRLCVASREQCEPMLPPKTKSAFDHFVGLANKTCLHALDWDRFYRFVRRCHRYRVHTNDVDLHRLLWKAGFSESDAAELSSLYIRLRRYSEIR